MCSEQTLQFIRENKDGNPVELSLQAQKHPEVDFHFAITQIAGRQAIEKKIPIWYITEGIFYPAHLSVEQCSSELTARYKASLVKGDSLVDLTGGMGVDCYFLSMRFKKAVYIEQQEELCNLAQHNFPLLAAKHIEVKNIDALTYLKEPFTCDCIYLDPARRNRHGGKIVSISDCEPNVIEMQDALLATASTVMVKLSPMLDISLALQELPAINEIHVVSVDNECKELLFLLHKEPSPGVRITCVNLKKDKEPEVFSFDYKTETSVQCEYTSEVGEYIYEPNSSILKAGGFKEVAITYNLKKLHPNSHLYTSDKLVGNFPGRTFRLHSVITFNKKDIKTKLSGLTKANLTVRNFLSTVVDLRKRLKLKDGGDDYLFATTLADESKVILHCSKVVKVG